MPTYKAILTTLGLTRLAQAIEHESPLVFKYLAVGDGGGSPITPVAGMTSLVNESARVLVNTVEVSPDEPTTVRVEGLIPAATGGFTIREAGLFNPAGELIAVASYPPIYKPVPGDGVSVDEYIRILLVYADVGDAIALTVDPNVIMATRLYVDEQLDFWNSNRVKIWREQLIGVISSPTNAQVPDYPLLRGHSNGTGGMGLGDPQAIYGGRFITLGGTDGAIHSFGSTAPIVVMADDRIISVEFDANLGASDTDDLKAKWGLQASSDVFSGTTTNLAQLYRDTAGVFYLQVADSIAFNAVVIDGAWGWHRIKIQIFGSDTPHAVANGSAFTRILIDDIEQGRMNQTPPGSTALHFAGGAHTGADLGGAGLGGWIVWWLDHHRPVPAPPITDSHVEGGYSAITIGSGNTHEYLDVTFDRDFDAATGADGYYVDVEISLTADDGPVSWVITNKTTGGCRIRFSDSFAGEVRWRAYA